MAKSKAIKKDYYDSIEDLPIYNWFQVEEKNDVGYLLKYKIVLTPEKELILLGIWDSLVSQYIDEFGISESFLEILLIRKNIKCLEIDEVLFVVNNQTLIKIENRRIESLSKQGQSVSNYELKGYVEKYLSFKIDIKTVSVKEYFHYLRMMNKEYSTAKNQAA